MSYRRILSPIEAKRHFIYIESDSRSMFPPARQKFMLNVGNHKYEVEIDLQGRIWAAAFRDKIDMHEGGSFEIVKSADTYTLQQLS